MTMGRQKKKKPKNHGCRHGTAEEDPSFSVAVGGRKKKPDQSRKGRGWTGGGGRRPKGKRRTNEGNGDGNVKWISRELIISLSSLPLKEREPLEQTEKSERRDPGEKKD